MPDDPRRRTHRPRGPWVLVMVLLVPAFVVPLCVPIYDRVDPTLGGFPFFFWFQFALIFGAVALTGAAYAVARVADRADRIAHGLSAEPGDPR